MVLGELHKSGMESSTSASTTVATWRMLPASASTILVALAATVIDAPVPSTFLMISAAYAVGCGLNDVALAVPAI